MIFDRLGEIAAERPHDSAIYYLDNRISFNQLNDIIDKLACGLHRIGISKGDRVALVMPNFPHFIFSYLAVLKLGAVIVPINYMLMPDDLNLVLNDAKPKAVIYWEGFRGILLDFFKTYSQPVLKLVLGRKKEFDSYELTKLIESGERESIENVNQQDETAVIQYTAGISEPPVGAELSFGCLVERSKQFIDFYRLSPMDVFGIVLPLFMVFNQSASLFSALYSGCAVVLQPKLDMTLVAKSIDEQKISLIIATPSFYNKLARIEADKFNGGSLKFCIAVQAPVTAEVSDVFERRFKFPLSSGYALTEAGGIVAATHPVFENVVSSVGAPFSGIDMRIHDQHGEQVATDELGEIAIRNSGLFSGYWGNEQLTAARVRNGWFYPGDLGKRNMDNSISFIERKLNVIAKSGFMIISSEIEQILQQHPKVKEAAVVSVPHPKHKEDVMAVIVAEENQTLTEQEIFQFCREQFPVYKCPQSIRFLSELPRSRMGKVLKRLLKSEINYTQQS
ncbi:MAG: AMP-binding protein [bacterium]|nr:AMP-binding protein [bacterium]